jgi:hypothetical protein
MLALQLNSFFFKSGIGVCALDWRLSFLYSFINSIFKQNGDALLKNGVHVFICFTNLLWPYIAIISLNSINNMISLIEKDLIICETEIQASCVRVYNSDKQETL